MHQSYRLLFIAKIHVELCLERVELFFEKLLDEMMTSMQENEQMHSIDDTVDILHPNLWYMNEYFSFVWHLIDQIQHDHQYPKEDVELNNFARYHIHETLFLQEDINPKILQSMAPHVIQTARKPPVNRGWPSG